jgi:hypothetical protein
LSLNININGLGLLLLSFQTQARLLEEERNLKCEIKVEKAEKNAAYLRTVAAEGKIQPSKHQFKKCFL